METAMFQMHKKLPEIAATSLLAAWLALPSPVLADPPPWAPAHGYRAKQYHYVYYPRHEVYYAPSSQLWFWLDGGNWRVGAGLPTASWSPDSGGVHRPHTSGPMNEHLRGRLRQAPRQAPASPPRP
jgi:hypothetical protein